MAQWVKSCTAIIRTRVQISSNHIKNLGTSGHNGVERWKDLWELLTASLAPASVRIKSQENKGEECVLLWAGRRKGAYDDSCL